MHCAIGAWQLWNAREGWKYEGCISCNSFWQLGRRDRLQGCEMVRMWGGEMVRWCLQLPAFPLSPPKGVLWSYIYHLVWGGSSLSWGKRLNMASLPLKCSSSLQSLKQQHTPEIYEPEWHLSFGVVWMGAEHSPASLSQKAFLDFSWLFSARVIFQKALCLRRQFFLFIPFFAQWRTWCICIRRRGNLLGSVRYYYCTD